MSFRLGDIYTTEVIAEEFTFENIAPAPQGLFDPLTAVFKPLNGSVTFVVDEGDYLIVTDMELHNRTAAGGTAKFVGQCLDSISTARVVFLKRYQFFPKFLLQLPKNLATGRTGQAALAEITADLIGQRRDPAGQRLQAVFHPSAGRQVAPRR
jgi:hypothetical protein